MKNQEISFIKGCLYITISTLIMAIILIVSAIYIEKNTDNSEYLERRLHRANFLESVEFQGEILRIEKLGWKYRDNVSVCIKLNKLQVDSSKILESNSFLNLDWKVTGLVFGGLDYYMENRFMEMNEVHLVNENGIGKIMLYNISDSIDATQRFYYLVNSKNTTFCRDFVE